MAKNYAVTTEGIEQVPFEVFVEKAYLDYSMYVVLDRSLPHIADGLKPVQRRIVYAMSELGLTALAKYKKSARTVGDVLGKYHPHGDSACYEAMVLMAQPFSYRYPLVDGQGNFGSQDDPKSFAAMRYTESRLSAYAAILLEELEQGTVEWLPNFDGTMLEPALLPARLPNLILNGASGIAVGMATDIPPHNVGEVAEALLYLLEHPQADLQAIFNIIAGPDFPTGGEIITSKEELFNIYEKGTGTVRLRATYKTTAEEIVIDSLPYQISGARVVEQIAEQMQAKKLPMVIDVRDEGDHVQPTRVVLELRSQRVDVESLMSHLFATTDLESTVRINLNMIGINGRPQVKNLLMILREWLEYRLATLRRRLAHRLAKVQDRLHLLAGLMIVYLNLDEIIAIIREEDEPKSKLMNRFQLSEKQAEAVLETKLRHLAKLEEEKILKEQENLRKEMAGLEKILASNRQLSKFLAKEIEALKDQFADKRRSRLIARAPAQALAITETVASEPVTVILSEKGWVRMAKGHDIDAEKLTYRTGDRLLATIQGKSQQMVVFFDASGRAYALPANQLPSARGHGEPLTSKLVVASGTHFVGLAMPEAEDLYLLAQSYGYGFLVAASELQTKNRHGKAVMKVKENEIVLPPLRVTNKENTYVAALTKQGYLLIFPLLELPILPKGRGNKIIHLPKAKADIQDIVLTVALLRLKDHLQIYSGNQKFVLKSQDWQNYVKERGRRGHQLPRGLRQLKGMEVIQQE